MKVIDQLDEFIKPDFAVVTIGTFDGVHIGHQTILQKVVSDARNNQGKSILITFWPHPRFILNKDSEQLKLLTTFEEKVDLVKELGIDYNIKIPFTPAFSDLSADDFVKEILVNKVGTKKLYIGYDHHFGNNREGNIDFLKKVAPKYHFEVMEIARQDIDDIGVSSTKIRKALLDGNIQLANSLLGRNFSLTGKVIHGNKKGRELGYPTANLEIPESYKLLPGDGSYAVMAHYKQQKFKAMLNIGFKPTVDGSKRTIETHLFNFDQQIYDEFLTIEFIQSLRKEMKFENIEQLRKQLELDEVNALNIL